MSADVAFRGFIESTLDALLIFEGCRRGMLPKISRRLQESEKQALVVSGSVFVFDEEETGIKRWTDGLYWSPSRTLGNFLLYRELDKKGSSRDAGSSLKDNAANGACDEEGDSLASADRPSTSSSRGPSEQRRRSFIETGSTPNAERARERALVGSLTSSKRFRRDGLVKKTISVHGLHMIGYYRIEDVTSGRLRTPSSHPELMAIDVAPDMLSPTLFRVPPVVEVGTDGQLHYKAESDAPLSPTATRPGSSQGQVVPVAGSSRSRPPSSESATGSQDSPHLMGASLGSTSQGLSNYRQPVSTSRSAGRFEPYGQTGRGGTPVYGSGPSYTPQERTLQAANARRRSIQAELESYPGDNFIPPGPQPFPAPANGPQGQVLQWSGVDSLYNLGSHVQSAPPPSTYYAPESAAPYSPPDLYPPAPGSSAGIFSYQPPPAPSSSALPNGVYSHMQSRAPDTSYAGYRSPLPPSSAPGYDRGGTASTFVTSDQQPYYQSPPATAPAQYYRTQRYSSGGGPPTFRSPYQPAPYATVAGTNGSMVDYRGPPPDDAPGIGPTDSVRVYIPPPVPSSAPHHAPMPDRSSYDMSLQQPSGLVVGVPGEVDPVGPAMNYGLPQPAASTQPNFPRHYETNGHVPADVSAPAYTSRPPSGQLAAYSNTSAGSEHHLGSSMPSSVASSPRTAKRDAAPTLQYGGAHWWDSPHREPPDAGHASSGWIPARADREY